MILVIVFLFVIICFKWGDWRNWRVYYPTILFLIGGDFIASYVFSAKPLWRYEATIISGVLTQLIIALVVYPCTVMVFLSSFQKPRINKAAYFAVWVCFYSALEYLGVKFHYFAYYNGWNFACSVIFNIVLFELLVVHQKNPPKAWLLSFITGLGITFWFKLPALF